MVKTKRKNRFSDNGSSQLREIKPKTINQADYLRAIIESTVTVCHGPSGTGKTMCAVGIACQKLMHNEIEQILISRSIVGCGKEIGHLPGGVESKIHPYMQPLLDYFNYFLGRHVVESLIYQEKLKIMPVELIRGHTYHNTFMILDEVQNCTPQQLKLFMSRIGRNSKMVLIGDTSQSDTKINGLQFITENFQNCDDTSIITLETSDIIRNPIIAGIIKVFEKCGF